MAENRKALSTQNQFALLYQHDYPICDLDDWCIIIEDETNRLIKTMNSKKPHKEQNMRKTILRLASLCFRALYSASK